MICTIYIMKLLIITLFVDEVICIKLLFAFILTMSTEKVVCSIYTNVRGSVLSLLFAVFMIQYPFLQHDQHV